MTPEARARHSGRVWERVHGFMETAALVHPRYRQGLFLKEEDREKVTTLLGSHCFSVAKEAIQADLEELLSEEVRFAEQQAQSLKGVAARCAFPVQSQMLEKWRQLLPLRVAKQEGILDQPGYKRKFSNQHSTPGTKVSQVVTLVDKAL